METNLTEGAPDGTTSAPETQQETTAPNAQAVAALDEAIAKRRAPGRPRKGAGAASAPADPGVSPEVAPAAPVAGKKAKKSGGLGKKTRSELVAIVRAYRNGETPAGEKLPAAVAPKVEPPPAPAAVVAGNEEAKEKFAKGVARFSSAIMRFVARRRGVHWQLDAIDAAAIGEASADCLEAGEEMAPSLTPWLQKGMQLAPFALLGGVLYEVVDSRLEIEAQIAAGKKERVLPGAPSAPTLKAVK